MSIRLFFLILALVLALVASYVPAVGRLQLLPLAIASLVAAMLTS